MNVEVVLHVEVVGEEFVWWAESEQLPGLSASAGSLFELRRLVPEAVAFLLDTDHDARSVEQIVFRVDYESAAIAAESAPDTHTAPVADASVRRLVLTSS